MIITAAGNPSIGTLSNADSNISGALAITIEAGVLLAPVYLLTRRLWLSIGSHIAWNFTQNGIFSGSVVR